MMTHDEMIAVIQHHKNGGKVEYKHCDNAVYVDDVRPSWDFSAFDYRPKPEPMVIYIQVFNDNSVRYCGTQKPPHNPKITLKKFIEVIE
jgi:hypothetical protein